MDTVLNFLHSMALSTSNKRWLADHLYEEVRAEQAMASAVKVKKKLTEKEKDEMKHNIRTLCKTKYNWETSSRKLASVYQSTVQHV